MKFHDLLEMLNWRASQVGELSPEHLSVEGLPYAEIPPEHLPAVQGFRRRRQDARRALLDRFNRTR